MGSDAAGDLDANPWDSPIRTVALGVAIGALLTPPCTSVLAAALGASADTGTLAAVLGLGFALVVGQVVARDFGGEAIGVGLVGSASGAWILAFFGAELAWLYGHEGRGTTEIFRMLLALPAWAVALAGGYLGAICGLGPAAAFAARTEPMAVLRVAGTAALLSPALTALSLACVSAGPYWAFLLGIEAITAGVLLTAWVEVRRWA